METPQTTGPEARLVFEAADIKFTAECVEGMWHVLCEDEHSGKSIQTIWTYPQVGAVLFLLAGTGEEEGTDQELTQLMYHIAEPLIKDWPPELRPIP